MLKWKNPCGFVIPTLKVSVTNPRGFFDWRNFYLRNLISQPLTSRLPLSIRLRLYMKSGGGALNYWGQNLLISSVGMKTFFNWRPLLCIEWYELLMKTKLYSLPDSREIRHQYPSSITQAEPAFSCSRICVQRPLLLTFAKNYKNREIKQNRRK